MNHPIIKGTCSEMCPETERKFRIKNNLISPFELVNGKPDQRLFIKEYSRPAAGQEIKCNELRTEEALIKTMNYIVNKIADKYESNNSKKIQSWYDFIWNRTRAIRKDITVQQLTGPSIIEILEKSARFHILCSYKLCEEPSNVFDIKINEENLTNCIQLLKNLYQESSYLNNFKDDEKSINNQSEFLCYYILKNLEKDYLIQEISSINKEIRKKSDLQFAIKVFISYKTHNYYLFMQLFLNSNLLQTCILVRYLNKVRLNAFYLIRRAVLLGQQKILISQEYFMEQLLFKENELKKFCKLINCDLEGNKISFTKAKELNLNANFVPCRIALIDQKFREFKFSDIINGNVNDLSVVGLLDLFKKVDFFNNPLDF